MTSFIHRLLVPVVFPHGICPGEGKDANLIIVARDGRGQPLLRGSALAGALRHAYSALRSRAQENKWFGNALDGEDEAPSPLRVYDAPITFSTSAADETLHLFRTHIAINRHTGSVLDGSLFSLEVLPPGSSATLCFWLRQDDNDVTPQQNDPVEHAKNFLADLLLILSSGLTLGGNSARGIGRVELSGKALYRIFDTTKLDQQVELLNEHRAWRLGSLPSSGTPLEPSKDAPPNALHVSLVLCVPQAQDLLIADGQGLDFEMEPQRVRCADGKLHWRIPGSSLRGVFRAWFSRLAARQGLPIADDVKMWLDTRRLSGDDLAWGFDDKPSREDKQDELHDASLVSPALIPCPIMRLFGSSYAKGRIHISDAIADAVPEPPARSPHEQLRMHVAVDRITGGANEGFLFDNSVITHGPQFSFLITIKHPEEQEVRWLAATLRALHLGILRIGSSKAGGRLALAAAPHASGPHAHILSNLRLTED